MPQKLDIKRAIKSRKLEVREIARRLGITPTGLSQHINGNPSVEVLERIADAIGCPVGELFSDYEEMTTATNTIACPYCGMPIAFHASKAE